MSWWEIGVENNQRYIYIVLYHSSKFGIKYIDITTRLSYGEGDAISMLIRLKYNII